jgi:N-acyl-D-amino-acid deacylase
MRDGAIGLSTSLQYPPAPYAETPELIALATEAAGLGGVYATHLRNESDEIMPALDEAIRIGREARIPVEVWHLKIAGKNNWGRMPEVVAKIDSARKAGVDIAADTYAYTAWFNSLSSFVPPWAHDGGTARLLERLRDPGARGRMRRDMGHSDAGWDNSWSKIEGPQAILIGAVHNPELRKYQGKTLADVARERGTDAIDALLDFLIEDDAYTYVAVFGMSEPDVALALEQPWVSINCDSEGAAPRVSCRRAIPTRAPTGPSRGSCGSTCGRRSGSPWRTRSGSSPRSRRSACGSAIAGCSRSGCGPMSWCSTPPPCATGRPSRSRTSSRRGSAGCW